jgi:transposase-like protein
MGPFFGDVHLDKARRQSHIRINEIGDAMSDLQNPIFHDESQARVWLESQVWPDGPFCPHCGSTAVTSLHGEAHRPGLYQCNEKECRKQFTVTVGTLFERSKIPLSTWLMATYLLSASKKGMSTRQLARMLSLPVKTAWFMTHRIREAMRESDPGPLGGEGQTVEADETYISGDKWVFSNDKGWVRVRKKGIEQEKVIALVERGGRARSFHVPRVNAKTARKILVTQIDRKSHLRTDESNLYTRVGEEFASHETVNHSIDEYVRGDAGTQVIENYFSIFKRGLNGIYQHVSQQHLKRYLCEFDFRYNTRHLTDHERTSEALKGILGKRLTYRRTDETRHA